MSLKVNVIKDIVWLHVDLPKGYFIPERIRVNYVSGHKRFAKGVLKHVRRYMVRARRHSRSAPKKIPFWAYMIEVPPPQS